MCLSKKFEIAYQSSERAVRLAKLHWWRGEIAALFEGTPSHPITMTLLPTVKNFSLHQQRFYNVLESIETHLHIGHYPSDEALLQFLYKSAGEIEVIAAMILSHPHSVKNPEGFRALGVVNGLLESLSRTVMPAQVKFQQDLQDSLEGSLRWHDKAKTLITLKDPNLEPSVFMLKVQQKIFEKIQSIPSHKLKAQPYSLSPLRLWWMRRIKNSALQGESG